MILSVFPSLAGPLSLSDSITTNLATKVLNNLHLVITRLHIRYEDDVSLPGNPFACGLTLEEISAHSTNAQWKSQSQPPNPLLPTFKYAEMKHLSLYLSTPSSESWSKKIHFDSYETFVQEMSSMVPRHLFVFLSPDFRFM